MDLENLGPLTTSFVPPPSCASDFVYRSARPTEVFHNSAKADCYPPELTRGATIYPLQGVYFSPGLCPSGWQSERGDAIVTRLVDTGEMKLGEGEYAGICCPSNYYVGWESTSGGTLTASCVSDLVDPVNASACAGCEYFTEVPVRREDGQLVTAIEATLMVRWQASDLPLLEMRPPPSTSYGPATSGNILPSQTGGLSSEQMGLSTPQKIGIGVGVAVGALLVAMLFGFCLFVRRRRASRGISRIDDGVEELSGDSVTKLELPTDMAAAELKGEDFPTHHELGQSPVQHFPAVELPTNTTPVELDATPRDHHAPEPQLKSKPQELHLDTSSESNTRATETRPVEVSPLDSPTGIDVARQANRSLGEEQAVRTDREEEMRDMALQETKRLLEQEERLRVEQEVVRRRLAELQRQQGEMDSVRNELALIDNK